MTPEGCNHQLKPNQLGPRHAFVWDDAPGERRNVYNPFAPICRKCGTSVGDIINSLADIRATMRNQNAEIIRLRAELAGARAVMGNLRDCLWTDAQCAAETAHRPDNYSLMGYVDLLTRALPAAAPADTPAPEVCEWRRVDGQHTPTWTTACGESEMSYSENPEREAGNCPCICGRPIHVAEEGA